MDAHLFLCDVLQCEVPLPEEQLLRNGVFTPQLLRALLALFAHAREIRVISVNWTEL